MHQENVRRVILLAVAVGLILTGVDWYLHRPAMPDGWVFVKYGP